MKNTKKFIYVLAVILILATIVASIGFILFNQGKKIEGLSLEQQRMQAYDKVKQGEEKTNSAYVNFDAFFLQDTNGDNIAEEIRGVCKEIGDQAKLYMELNVLTEGYLKNGTITINADNFYFETAIVKDGEIANNYISSNTKEIKLNQIQNGTQKLITGVVKSGNYSSSSTKSDAIGNDTTKYSKQNKIVFTGTHVKVNSDGTTLETQITKEVNFQVEWYGDVDCTIPSYIKGSTRNKTQTKTLSEIIDEENNTLNMSFNIATQENQNKLILKKAYIEGTIPLLNGYEPKSVTITGNNITSTYNDKTRKFIVEKEAILNENQVVTGQAYTGKYYGQRYTQVTLNIVYPLEAYTETGADTIEIKIPVEAYYEGYNNTSNEFNALSKSNTAKDTIVITYENPKGTVAKFEVTVGKYAYSPSYRYIVSKKKPLNIYNGVSVEETQDYYTVQWYGFTGSSGASELGMKMKETKDEVDTKVSDVFIKSGSKEESMENLTTNVGIYFSNPEYLLGEEGEIRVYNDETNQLIETFTKENWNNYSSSKFYKYEEKIKHIRIETSATNANSSLYVYNIKELDDEYITTHYEQKEFDEFEYIKSTLTGYVGGQEINTATHSADYEAPISVATLSISKSSITTSEKINNFTMTIRPECTENYNEEKWKNGAFLLKLPEEILGLEINSVYLNNRNVNIESYEQYEEEGQKFIKIITKNEIEENYTITIDCNITPNPKSITTTKRIELYASNENCENYYYKTTDIYDVDGDLNKEKNVNYDYCSLSFIAPNSLITFQTAMEFNETGETLIAPKIAEVSKEQKTAKIEISLINNYSSNIEEVVIQGKIPFEGSTYVLSNGQTDSQFNTEMLSTGITIPQNLQDKGVKVYYSSKENPNNNITDPSNSWTLTPNFAEVKSFLIDLSPITLSRGDTYDFTYEIKFPTSVDYNKISYSVHAVYFSLETEDGLYKTKTESSKLGFTIVKKYDLEITKYQKNNDTKKVSGATYRITKEEENESKTKVTDENGVLTLKDLYVEKIYVIKEIKSPEEYALNEAEVRFKTSVDSLGNLTVTILSNNAKSSTFDKTTNTVKISVEDEVKANLEIIKIREKSEETLQGVQFRIKGEGLGENGKVLLTDKEGKINLSGLYLNQDYTLIEIKANGYYIPDNPVIFNISEENGTFKVNITSGNENIESTSISINDEIPTANIKITNEKIPTYTLKIKKVEKDKGILLQGAQFKLSGKELLNPLYYITDEEGIITIENLYQYVEGKNVEAKYTLTEICPPEGYVMAEPITFKAQIVNEKLELKVESGTIKTKTTDGTTIEITIEDAPVFKLIKQDGETLTPLPNTKFVIYKVNENDRSETKAIDSHGNIVGTEETINGITYNVLTTNENGEISQDLPEGLYKAVEVQTLEKYELPEDIEDRSYYFSIGKASYLAEKNAVYNDIVAVNAGTFNFYIAVGDNGSIKQTTASFTGPTRSIDETINFTGVAAKDVENIIVVGDKGEVIKINLNLYTIWENKDKNYKYQDVTVISNSAISVGEGGEIVKYDLDTGEILWEKVEEDYNFTAVTTVEDGIVAVSKNGRIVKYLENGTKDWESAGPSNATDIITLGNEIIYVTSDGYIVKLSKTGGNVSGEYNHGYNFTGIAGLNDEIVAVGPRVMIKTKVSKITSNNIEWIKEDYEKNYTAVALTEDGILAIGEDNLLEYYRNDILATNSYPVISNFINNINDCTDISVYCSNPTYMCIATIDDKGYVRLLQMNLQNLLSMPPIEIDTIINNNYIQLYLFKTDYNLKEVIVNGFGVYVLTDKGDIIRYYNALKSEELFIENENFISIATSTNSLITGVTKDGKIKAYIPTAGRLSWEKEYEGVEFKQVEAVTNGIIALTEDGRLIRFDSSGNIMRQITCGSAEEIIPTNDGIIVSFGYGNMDKYDLNLSYIKQLSFPNTSVATLSDGFISLDPLGNIYRTQNKDNRVMQLASDYKFSKVVSFNVNYSNTVSSSNPKKEEKIENITLALGKDGILIYLNNETSRISYPYTQTTTIPQSKEIIVKNNLKKFKIITDVKETTVVENGLTKVIRGGNILGEGRDPYEEVEYGKDSKLEITATPDPGYKVVSITVNGESIPFKENADKTVTLDKFINMTEDKEVIVEFSNTKTTVNVHHYEATKNADGNYTYTINKLADDETISGTIGKSYTTQPKLNIAKYELIKEANGDLKLPVNAAGTLKETNEDVNYYYEKKEIPLTVHHYIQGTSDSVPAKIGETVADEIRSGIEGVAYQTSASTNISEKYELVETPSNANGTYQYDEVIVTYYYKLIKHNITTKVEPHEETDNLGVTTLVEGGTITGQEEKIYETVVHTENSVNPIKAEPKEGYQVSKITVNGEEQKFTVSSDKTVSLAQFTNVIKDMEVVVTFERADTQVTVHHYIYDKLTEQYTEEQVPLSTGEKAEDIIKQGKIGDIYATVALTDLPDIYELYEIPDNASGILQEVNEDVNYYYALTDPEITQRKSATTEHNKNYVIEGEKITYTIMLENAGGLLKEVTIKDEIPVGTTFVPESIKINNQADKSKTENDLKNGIQVVVPGRANEKNGNLTLSFDVTVNEDRAGDIKNIATVDDIETNETKHPVLNYEKQVEITRKDETKLLDENKVTSGDILTYTIIVKNTGTDSIKNITVKDKIPVGTKFVQVFNEGMLNLNTNEITWKISELPGGGLKTVSFEVEVNYSREEKTITNVATVDGNPTNETENPYTKQEVELESSIEKTGPEKITTKDTKIYYEINFKASIDNFVGKAVVTLVDHLPYPINEETSEIAKGTYNEEEQTLTWVETVENIDTYKAINAKEISLTKVLSLDFNYGSLNGTTGKMVNEVTSKIELLEASTENPEETEKIAEDNQKDEAETLIEIPTKVIVHHYIYDDETKEYTNIELALEETKEGIVGENYETTKSNKVPKNYKCIDEEPKDYQGTMKEEIIEVNYYYKLDETIIENSMEKTAEVKVEVEEKDTEIETQDEETGEENQTTEETTEETYPTLRKEDGKITYTINYKVKVQDYIGKADILIVDVLPYEIDELKSNLDGGMYNNTEKTIFWVEEVEIDTYANGPYERTITKEIEIVYKDQNVLEDLENNAIGAIKTYYPKIHSSNPGEEQNSETAMDKSTVKQEYKVDLKVIKEWEDNDNLKQRRPEDVTVTIERITTIQGETEESEEQQEPQIKKEQLSEVQLNEENNWTYEITNLPKYNEETGEKYIYEVIERETNENDLEYYEKPEITLIETQNDLKTTYTYIVTNEYKLMNTDLNTEIKKEGTEEITSSKQQVNYTIHFTAKIENYIGEGKVKIVDTLPYEIEEETAELNGGIYNQEKKTITWEEELPHINTYVSGKPYLIDITKTITVIYESLDATQEKMTNEVKGTVLLLETDQKDEKEGTFDTDINVKGKVIVRFVDKETGKDLEVLDENDNSTGENYNYEIEEKVGKEYETEKKNIPNYNYLESTNNETGTIVEETQEVIYYYERIPASVLVKHIDTEGNKLAEDELIEGKIWDEYETQEKQIENYELVETIGEVEGKMQKEQIEVTYIYDRIPTKVIVKYLEKGTEKELLEEELIEGKVGDNYETQRKLVENYKAAEPEPENNIGKMLKDPIIIIYYYERIPSGIVKVKYVDKETNEEITTDEKEYGYDISGYVGDEYETKEEDIPYYKLEETPENKNGTLTESGDTVIYYYRKLRFNMKIEKQISKIIVNGVEQKIKDGKIAKLEIKEKEIATTDIEIEYTIKVTNTEEIMGSAIIEENIPEGLTISTNNPAYWVRKDRNTLETAVELEAGESQDLLVVLKWEQGNTNFGDKQNRAQIKQTNNIPKYEETTKEDNQSIADLVISIQTGVKELMMIIILALTTLIADTLGAVYLAKYIRKK